MAAAKRRLGRGLASLINEEASVAAVTSIEGLRTVAIEAVQPSPLNPRTAFAPDDLQELADSIRTRGVVQPIIVRPAEKGEGAGGFEIIAGERRWRAAQAAGQRRSPAMISKPPAPSPFSAGRTMIGWTTPRVRMESASSLRSSGENAVRGLSGLG